MDYAAKFNELSRFAPHQVNIEERKMDHFEQGLRADIKSVTACQNFDNFQDMYQRAIKIARVLEETERENQARNLKNRRGELLCEVSRVEITNGSGQVLLREKGSNL